MLDARLISKMLNTWNWFLSLHNTFPKCHLSNANIADIILAWALTHIGTNGVVVDGVKLTIGNVIVTHVAKLSVVGWL